VLKIGTENVYSRSEPSPALRSPYPIAIVKPALEVLYVSTGAFRVIPIQAGG
jgi:hypothetical protein